MKRRFSSPPRPSSVGLGGLVIGLAVAGGACDTSGFGHPRGGNRLVVDLSGKDDPKVVGTLLDPLPLTINTPQSFKISVRALDLNGNVDASFNGWVRISSKPGAIERIEAQDADGRNVKLTNGVSPEVEVKVTNAYGTSFILADDLGYEPADPNGTPPPACADGKDNDGDGLIDFPADPGCAFANDNTETGGSYAQGATAPIFYHLPRIADARGLVCSNPADPTTCSGSGKTPYPKQPLQLDTGFHLKADGSQVFDFDMVVTRISSDGFFVTDTKDKRGAFTSAYSFNFSPPPDMRVCDRLKTFAGTATEFFGFTQISYPTWTLDQWDPQQRPCLVPEPAVLGPTDIPSDPAGTGKLVVPATLLGRTASLVRVISDGTTKVMVTPKFGPGPMPCKDAKGGNLEVQACLDDPKSVFVPSPDAGTDCDLNKNGKIDFGVLPSGDPTAENRCSDACTGDPECTEYSNFAARSTFRLTVTDGNSSGAIQADASAASEFKPLEMKGKQIKSFSGTLTFFSGGSQYTIEARCKDDIVPDPKDTPLPSDKACITPRQAHEENPQQ